MIRGNFFNKDSNTDGEVLISNSSDLDHVFEYKFNIMKDVELANSTA